MNTEKAILNLSNEDARAILLQLLNTQNGSVAVISEISIQKTMDEFLRSLMNADSAGDTIEGYETTFNEIKNVIDVEADISTISQDAIEKFRGYLQDRGPSKRILKKPSINRRLRECKAWINACKKRGYINRPIEIKEFKVDQVPVYISEQKQDIILAKMKPEHREFIHLYLSLGCRLRELFDGELESDNFIVLKADKSKSRKRREFELSDSEVKIYRRLMASGLSPERLSRLYKKACVEAGYPEHHFHHIRHSMAVMNIHIMNIYQLSKKLGHSSVKVTESFYLRFSERRIRKDFPSLFDAE